jgi:hypothetical protein
MGLMGSVMDREEGWDGTVSECVTRWDERYATERGE